MIKSHSVVSEMENYQDNVDEFLNLNQRRDLHQNKEEINHEEDEANPFDETIGYIQILDEYEKMDKYKKLPRTWEGNGWHDKQEKESLFQNEDRGHQKEERVNMPKFSIQTSPFQRNSDYFQNNRHQKFTQSEILQNNRFHHQSSKSANDFNVPKISQSETAIVQAGPHHQAKTPTKRKGITTENSTNNISIGGDYNNQFEDSLNEDNMENDIFHQIAVQIPEMLEKSEMNNLGFSQSMVEGFKTQKLQEEKSRFSKLKKIDQEEELAEEEIINQNKVEAKEIVQDNLQVHQRLSEKRASVILSEQQLEKGLQLQEEQRKLMEGYETDPPAPAEDENVIYTLAKKEFEFHKKRITKQAILDYMRDYTYISAKDECRTECSNKDGGKECKDKKIKECLRTIGKEIIKQVGKKILSGSFNLTTISFPIRAMIPKTALEKALYSTILFPLYINLATETNDLVQRFKLLICATLGNFYINCGFLKPLNPILGETCQGVYPDGTKLYAEQISHHPPISYFSVYGPDKSYIMYGNYNYESNAGWNSVKLKNKGSRHIKFKDGQTVSYNFAKEVYSGSVLGAMTVESKGVIIFNDIANNIIAEIAINSVKKRPTDYLSGTIKVNGKEVSKIYGTYMGFIEFDDIRYWDFRYVLPYEPIILKSNIGSDQSKRLDKHYLIKGDIPRAQAAKEELENQQRTDAKLRKNYAEKLAKKLKKK